MAQKIYDIIPPNKKQKIEEKIVDIPVRKEAEKLEKPKEIKKVINKKEINFSYFKRYVPFLLLILFLLFFGIGIFAYSSFSSVEIEAWIKTEEFVIEDEVKINKDIEYVNVVEKSIPGKIFSEEKSVNQNFLATGITDARTRATGIITVYNDHSTASQIIVAETRFVSSDGKVFRSIKRETIPGGKYVSGKLEPGSIDIEVKAVEPGEEYNIGPDNFSIPGFLGTEKYIDFYGKSSSDMKGGFIGESAVILEEDIDNAKETLKEVAKEEAYKNLYKKALEEGFVLLKEDFVYKEEILEENLSSSEGDIVSNFNYEINFYFEFLGFKESDLKILTDFLIEEKISEKNKVKEEGFRKDYTVKEKDEEGNLTVKLNYNFESYLEFNLDDIKKSLFKKNREKVKEDLLSMPFIERIEINSWPLLRKNAPENKEKINIKVNI